MNGKTLLGNTKTSAPILIGFDTETYSDKNTFLLASLVSDSFSKTFYSQEDFFEFIFHNWNFKQKKSMIFATNLMFDIMTVTKNTRYIEELEPLIRNGLMICGNIKTPETQNNWRKNIKFYDTLSFAPFSVEKWGEILKIPKLEQPDFLGRKPKNDVEWEQLKRYNLRDSEITFMAAKLLAKGYANLGGKIRMTASSSAIHLYQKKYQPFKFFKPEINGLLLIKKGYYGGRTEAIQRGLLHDFFVYDVNSLYPFVMQKYEYPDVNYFELKSKISNSDIDKYEGICYAELLAPYFHIPYLPLRTKTQLIFPYGKLKGYYSFFELRKALDMGYSLLKTGSGVCYYTRFKPFKEYIKTLFSVRKSQKADNNPLELVTKLTLNSTYGKFAQKFEEQEKIVHKSKIEPYMLEQYDFDRTEDFFIFRRKNIRQIPKFENPILSAYTTAYARDYLYEFFKKCGEDNVFYFDTDSIFTPKILSCSDEIGGLKKELTVSEAIICRPKMYTLNNAKFKCKGLRKADNAEMSKIFSGSKVKIRKFAKFKEANRRKFEYNQIFTFEKEFLLEDTKRAWESKFSAEKLQISKPLLIQA